MKVLFSVNCFKGGSSATTDGNIIYPAAWATFLRRHQHEIKGDFTILNYGFNPYYFKLMTHGVDSYTWPHNFLPSDPDQTFECVMKGEGYDYVVRTDADMFPSVESLNNMVDFLEKNPVDLLSPANATQCFHQFDYPTPDEINGWAPWTVPTVGNCLVFFRREFIMKCLELYNKHPKIAKTIPNRPFITSSLTYGDCCDVLGTECPPQYRNSPVGIDGQISSDFWTIMCSQGVTQGWIVNDDGKSFACKDHLSLGTLHGYNTFNEATDAFDRASQHPDHLKVRAPFFHKGAGYDACYHFDVHDNPPGKLSDHKDNYLRGFYKNGELDFWALHAAVTHMLTVPLEDKYLLRKLEDSIQRSLLITGVDKKEWIKFYDRVYEFYSVPLKPFL